MSIKTTLTNPPMIALIALQIIGGILILASMMGFRSGGMLWPMLGSGTGTGLLILGWEQTKEKHAALQDDQEKPESVRSDANIDPPVAPTRQICPKCGAEVRIGSVLERFHISGELNQRSGATKKSKAITMANDKPNKPSLAALKARMDSLQERMRLNAMLYTVLI
jgi:hypothetical protein